MIQTQAVLVATCLFALLMAPPALCAGEPAQRPAPYNKDIECWTGKWKYEEVMVSNPFLPAGKRTLFSVGKFVNKGHMVELQGRDQSREGYTWTEIYYYDHVKKTWANFYCDSDGIANNGPKNVDGQRWSSDWEEAAQGKTYKCRCVVTFAADGKSYTYEWTYSEDGQAWLPWVKGKATKTGNVRVPRGS